jgi:hypothetical protein
MEFSIDRLHREVRVLKILVAVLSGLFISFLFLAFTQMSEKDDIIRVKGIIVQDESGNDRILIGAPVPDSKNRIRSNFEQAQTTWGKRYPRFDWYKGLNNATNGIVILDDKGFDRLAIGDPVPDPNIGKRIAASSGIVINDKEGFERTGWGFFPEKNRVVLGLDDDKGMEGATLSILEDGNVGLSINAGRSSIYLGNAPPKSFTTDLPGRFHGLIIRDSSEVVYKMNSFEHRRE